MSPEYGSTAAIFPIDEQTLRYLHLTGRSEEQIALVEAYAKEQGLFHDPSREYDYSEVLSLDLSTIEPSLAGPSRPQDRVLLSSVTDTYRKVLPQYLDAPDGTSTPANASHQVTLANGDTFPMTHGQVLISAITSCTNTSNPSVMVAAGLVAKKAVERGLTSKPWVKTMLAPGSKVVTDYYDKVGLTPYLEKMGFHTVGYGCTACIGNSGALQPEISDAVRTHNLATAAVLSGNRNFEARINPDIKLNFLASPPLVVAYAIAGTLDLDITKDALGVDPEGNEVFLKDIWPSNQEVEDTVAQAVQREMFVSRYSDVFKGDERWQNLSVPAAGQYEWRPESTYVQRPPYFDGMEREPAPLTDITGARILAKLADSITTDHISPAGSISLGTPPADFLLGLGVDQKEFNSLGARRGNHEVMMRGTFANVRLKNQVAPGTVGGLTRHFPSGDQMSIYDAAMRYREESTPLVVVAGKEYGSGSSRDWAAKGPALLGVKAVLVESFERIHRSNLIGMGIVPLEMPKSANDLGIKGDEIIDIIGLAEAGDGPGGFARTVEVFVRSDEGRDPFTFTAKVRIDTPNEAAYYRNGGILQFVLRQLLNA
jgi:aconitate hydratase